MQVLYYRAGAINRRWHHTCERLDWLDDAWPPFTLDCNECVWLVPGTVEF